MSLMTIILRMGQNIVGTLKSVTMILNLRRKNTAKNTTKRKNLNNPILGTHSCYVHIYSAVLRCDYSATSHTRAV